MTTPLEPRATPAVLDLRATPASRNRAVDAYRAGAMCAVALGHWLAAAVVLHDDGSISGTNALSHVPDLHWLTLGFQVMPLFFCLGGYSNAASLDAHRRHGGGDADWVVTRLRRLARPATALATTWLLLLAVVAVSGVGRSIAAGAAAVAAIPLWFLANYVIDTAVAPRTLTWHRRHPRRFAAILAGTFLALEAGRLAGVAVLPKANVVLGWMLFQVLGFWWRDGRLPGRRGLLGAAATAAAACGALIALGPWPLAMVDVPDAGVSNTWPPTLALIAYGTATCAVAIAAAPAVHRLLERRFRLWRLVAGANTITMTVYLWHFSAMAAVGGTWWAVGWITDAPIGSGRWWLAKLPMIGGALGVLVSIVARLGRIERDALLGAPAPQGCSGLAAAGLAVALGGGFELWTLAAGNVGLTVAGAALVLVADRALRRAGHDPVGAERAPAQLAA